jgi:hypothetical protein
METTVIGGRPAKPSDGLNYAVGLYRGNERLNRKMKGQAAKQLASFGFDTSIIVKILDMSPRAVAKSVGYLDEISSKFNPQTLDALGVVAVGYEDDQHISAVLVKRIVEWGTALTVVATLCGIPLEDLREAIHE